MGKISSYAENTSPSPGDYLLGDTTSTTATNRFKVGNLPVNTPQISNPIKFSVYLSGSQSLPGSSYTKLLPDTKLFDTNSNFATTNARFTAPVAGFYQFNGHSGINTTRFLVGLFKNGSEIHRGGDIDTFGISNTNTTKSLSVSALIQLSVGDYVELWGYTNTAGAVFNGGTYDTYFNGFLVSTT